MININFNLRNASLDQETPINIVLRYKNQKLVYPSGLRIHPKNWDNKEQKAKGSKKFPEYPEFNRSIEIKTSIINTVYLRFWNENKEIPSVPTLKNLLDLEFGKTEKINHTFFSYFQKYIDNLQIKSNSKTGKPTAPKTISAYKNTLNILLDFQKTYPRKITFETIDMDFYHDFIEYLTKGRLMAANTWGKIIRNTKVILNDASENGFNKNTTYKSKRFTSANEASTSIYLNENELKQLYKLDLKDNQKLEKVRDLFLIGCYTGLRYSDYSNLNKKHIDYKAKMIEIKTQKTGENVAIPLHPIVQCILIKYKHELPKSFSNQKTNEYLKDIGKKIESFKISVTKKITKGGMLKETEMPKYDLISTHTARRSFATNQFISGFPAISIMKITGHTTEKSFMKYIKVTPTENAKLLQLHWDKTKPKMKVV